MPNKKLEENYLKIEREMLGEDFEDTEQVYENMSTDSCASCGNRLFKDEVEAHEDTCYDCIWAETSGLINDDSEKELGDE